MQKQILKDTIEQIFVNSKGILAMDESIPTCNKRFAANGIPQTVEMRRRYRELIVTTPGLKESIGGAILSDETIRQKTKKGKSFAKTLMEVGIIPGIKVDLGTTLLAGFPGEKITEGLDGLRERLTEYKEMGARFAKWRAVIAIGKKAPTNACIEANTHDLARYAALCQEAAIVPIVEPEVLMDGNHSLQECYEVTEQVLKTLFHQLYLFKVDLEGIILKPNMVIPGTKSQEKKNVDEVAEATVNCFLNSVPVAVPAIAFLSGGQSPREASKHLNAINKNHKNRLPWIVAFSFARAIQQPALAQWKGLDAKEMAAQKLLYHRTKLNAAARGGKYLVEMEYWDNYGINKLKPKQMKKEEKNIKKLLPSHEQEKLLTTGNEKYQEETFPGYPHYPASEDIYNQEEEVDLDPDNLSENKKIEDKPGAWNEKDFMEDRTGEDLDVPGAEADDVQEELGSEDEENNYYSLGGDRHKNLEEN